MARPQMTPGRGPSSVGRIFSTLKHTILGDAEAAGGNAPAMAIAVRCGKCGEIITTRVDKANEMLCEFGDVAQDAVEPPHPVGYTLHKEFLGRGCQNLVQLTMHFDEHRRATSHQIEGGELVACKESN